MRAESVRNWSHATQVVGQDGWRARGRHGIWLEGSGGEPACVAQRGKWLRGGEEGLDVERHRKELPGSLSPTIRNLGALSEPRAAHPFTPDNRRRLSAILIRLITRQTWSFVTTGDMLRQAT